MDSNKQLQKPKKTENVSQKQLCPHPKPLTRDTHPGPIIQGARADPRSLKQADVMQLQRTIGNRAVGQLMSEIGWVPPTNQHEPVQRQAPEEEEELMQGKFDPIQLQDNLEEEELLQGKLTSECIQCQEPEDEELMQGKFEAIQRQGPEIHEESLHGKFTSDCIQCQVPEEEELIQGKFVSGLTGTLQAKEEAPPNKTGMPDYLKSGIEKISGVDISDVRVHYNSSKPKQLNALAYTQGQEIYVAPGQEKHLPHEGWHVVQQKQGRVKPTMQMMDGIPVNNDKGLEHEADAMGAKAMADAAQLQRAPREQGLLQGKFANRNNNTSSMGQSLTRDRPIQRAEKDETGNFVGLDMATSSLVGVAHEETKSFATVRSEAWMSSISHRVVYEIKWDAAVTPGGDHLDQVRGQASDWIVDKSKDGVPIGDRKDENAPYFNNDTDMNHAPETGRYFSFNDAIQQRRLRGGSWWFRLKVVDKENNVLSQSHDVEVNWGE